VRLTLAALLLLPCLASALGFQGYAYLLSETRIDYSALYLNPQSCAGFLYVPKLPANLKADSAFSPAVEEARLAEQEFGYAAWYAFIQLAFNPATPAGDGVYRYASVACHTHGALGLNHAVLSAKSGLSSVDARLAKLDKMLDSSFTGPAAGFLEDLAEAEALIVARDGEGESFGAFFERARSSLEEAQASIDYAPNAAALTAAADSSFALLSRETILFEEANAAIASLEEEYALSLDSTRAREAEAKQALRDGEALGLDAVSEDAFLAVGAGSKAATQYAVQSFERDLAEASASCSLGSWGLDEAERVWRSSDAGYASRAINALRDSAARLDSCSAMLVDYAARGYELEAALRERANAELAAALEATQAQPDAYAYSAALAQIQSSLDNADAKVPSLGGRVNLYLRLVNRALEIESQLGEWSGDAFHSKAFLEGEVERVAGVLAAAKSDGLNLEQEESRLSSISAALKPLGSTPRDAAALAFLASDLVAIEESAYAAARLEYADALEADYALVAPLESLFPVEKQADLLEASAFFASGWLDERAALGSLAGLRETLAELVEYSRVQAPNLIRARLVETLSISYGDGEPYAIGTPSQLSFTVRLENDLLLSYDGLLAVETAELSRCLEGAGLPAGFRYANNALLLDGVAEGEVFEFVALKTAVAATRAGSSVETLFARADEARVLKTVLFDADYPGFYELDEVTNGRVVAAESDQGAVEWSTDGKAFAFFEPGRHWFALEFSVANPVHVAASLSASGSFVELNYSLRNDYGSLEDFEYADYVDVGCEPRSVIRASSEGLVVAAAKARHSTVVLSVASFEKGATEWASIRFECDSIASAAEARVEYLEELAASLNASVEQELLALRGHLEDGRFDSALSASFELERALLAAPESQATADGLDGFKSEIAAFAATVSDDELRNALEAAAELGDYDSVSSALDSLASARVAALYAACKTCAGEAKGFLAVGKPLDALESCLKQEVLLAAEAASEAVERGEIEALLADYSSLRPDASAFLSSFATAFKTAPENQATARRSAQYSAASKQAAALEKSMKALDKLVADSSKANAASVEALLQDCRSASAGLSDALASLLSDAQAELALAGAQQKQFGDSGTAGALYAAQAEFEGGAYYSAYASANALRRQLLALPAQDGGNEYWRIVLGAFGTIALLALAWVFMRGKPAGSREL